MENVTVVIPFWNGEKTINRLLASLPGGIRVIVVVDKDSVTPSSPLPGNPETLYLDKRRYFAGAVNAGVSACDTDVLILNQDAWLEGDGWRRMIDDNRQRYAIIGDGVMGHPAWPKGYIQGTFMFVRRDAINGIGPFNERDYPLWGATAEWQLRACRHGYNALPVANVPGLMHEPRGQRQYGNSMAMAMEREPDKRWLFTRTPPAISVIIPCYNYGRYLQDAMDSLMAQTFQSFDVVIVDDASTDGSWKIAQSLADDFKAVRVTRNRANLGTAATINAGIRKSFGRFITVLSADDKYMPDRLERMYRTALANPHSVICDDVIWWTDTGQTRKYMGWREDGASGPRRYDFDVLLERNHMHAGVMYSRRAWTEAGGYPEIMRDGREDWAFNVALGRVGYCGVLMDYAGYVVRRQGQNRTLRNTTPAHHQEFLQRLRHLFPDAYNGGCEMCCGHGGNKPKSKIKVKGAPAPRPLGLPDGGDGTLLEYIGRNVGNQIFYGAETGRSYKFGYNPARRQGFVDPRDVPQLLGTKQFRQARMKPHTAPIKVAAVPDAEPAPQVADPVSTVEPDIPFTDRIESEPGQIVSGEIGATDSARKYANEHSIDLGEIEVSGRRITYRDVKTYAERIGLA
jgi:glycosyltransferase involved in cell wall biosynthesis